MLKVSFTYPKDGWMPFSIKDGDQKIMIDASYLPHRSLEDLISALMQVLRQQGESTVSWCTEPVEYDMHFSSKDGLSCLSIIEWSGSQRSKHGGKLVFHAQYAPANLVLPFWRALRALQHERRESEFRDAWGSPFPSAELASLSNFLDK